METRAAPRRGRSLRMRAWLEAMGQEVRHGARALRKSPGFTAVAMTTLALGIGANTAMFSVVNAVLLRPLPFKDSDRLVTIWASLPRRHRDQLPTSLLDYFDWRRQATGFASLAAFTDLTLNLSRAGEPEHLAAFEVSADLFPTLRVTPALGRNFTLDEDRRGGPRVVILGDGDLRRRRRAGPHRDRRRLVASRAPGHGRRPRRGFAAGVGRRRHRRGRRVATAPSSFRRWAPRPNLRRLTTRRERPRGPRRAARGCSGRG